MAKRFQPMKDLARAKKPKLNVSIGHNVGGGSNVNVFNRCAMPPPPPQPTARSNVIDFWDDDDDDVILLATQKAEAAVVQRTQSAAPAVIDLTFSEFAPQVHGTTSTQAIFPAPSSSTKRKSIDDMFGDDDGDFDFMAVAEVEQQRNKSQELPAPPPLKRQETIVTTAATTTTATTTTTTNEIEVQVLSHATTTTTLQSQTAARRQLAQERQIKFLVDRVDSLKKEVGKLQKDLGDSKERCESKDGETGLLRDELRHLRHQLEASKMEKLKMAKEAKTNCDQKVGEVYKQVAAKETELTLKEVEYKKMKMRHMNETRNFETSLCIEDGSTSVLLIDTAARRNMLRLQHLNLDDDQQMNRIPPTSDVFEGTQENGGQKKRSTLFQLELEQLLLIYAQLQGHPCATEATTRRIISSVSKLLPEFWSYTHSLEFPQNCALYPYHSYQLQLDDSAPMRSQSLAQPSALFTSERAISLRRYLATLALICQQYRNVAQGILQHKQGEYWLLQIANDAIAKLGYSTDLCEHFGVLEAASALLRSLLDVAEGETQRELLFDLLKQLVFTRPSPWIFREISACLLLCTRQPELLSQLCVNSPKDCFVSDRVRSLYRFGPDSCLLQVYAGLLELAFASETSLMEAHFELLLTICAHHVRFVYQCFSNPPDFVLEMLPSIGDDDDNDDTENCNGETLSSNSTVGATHGSASTVSAVSGIPPTVVATEQRGCECYVKLCLSVVTLVYQMLHQWILKGKNSDTSQVAEISHIAVHLLTLIFREYYLTCLFRDSEETTKHYLFLICNWWKEHAQLLQFQDIHMRFLRHLEDSHFMLKPLHQESNPTNPANDLLEWNRTVANADAKVEKYFNPNVPFNYFPLSAVRTRKFFDGMKQSAYDFE